jgi:hypothetical protein
MPENAAAANWASVEPSAAYKYHGRHSEMTSMPVQADFKHHCQNEQIQASPAASVERRKPLSRTVFRRNARPVWRSQNRPNKTHNPLVESSNLSSATIFMPE